jgi:hypothetical protein
MLEALRGRLTYANVVATLALFLAIGGGMAFALASNSVKSRHIKNGQVKPADLGTAAVTESKLASGAVTSSKLGGGSVTTEKLGDGSVTATKLDAAALSASGAVANLDDGFNNCATLGVGDEWIDQSPDVNLEAGWILEPSGIVHLQGTVRRCGTAGETIFTLPEDLGPASRVHLATFDEMKNAQEVQVDQGGAVTVPGAPIDVGIFLDGLSYPVADVSP